MNTDTIKTPTFCKKQLKSTKTTVKYSTTSEINGKIIAYRIYLGVSTQEASHIKCMGICMS
jgi:hypothetical protein